MLQVAPVAQVWLPLSAVVQVVRATAPGVELPAWVAVVAVDPLDEPVPDAVAVAPHAAARVQLYAVPPAAVELVVA